MNETFRHFLQEGEVAGARYTLSGAKNQARGRSGIRLGSGVGSSLEFLDHRQYHPGDDVRHIDWSAFGRSDRLTLKLFREEIAPHLDLLVDGSRSMNLGDSEKGHATLGLAAVFAQAAGNAGFSHTVWLVSATGCHRIENGHERPSHWDNLDFSFRGSPFEAVSMLPPAFRPYGLRFFLSDLLWQGEPLNFLKLFADKASQLVLVQVLSESDLQGPRPGNLQLVDSETDETLNIHIDEAARQRYRDSLIRHQEIWQTAAKHSGAYFASLVAEEVVRDWRFDDLVNAGLLQVRG